LGEYKVKVDSDGFIRATIIGIHDKDDAEKIIVEMNKLIKKHEQNCKILIDMTKTGRPTSKARKLHAINMKVQAEYFKKTAIFGGNAMNRVMANFIIKASGRGDKVKYFGTHQDAVSWLNKN
jgi:hypothetical protein